MRILAVAHYYVPHVGGLEVVARDVAEGLADAGHTVVVVTSALGNVPRRETQGRLTIHRVRAWNVLDRLFSLPFPIVGMECVLRVWRETGRADLVHVHDILYMTSWIAYLCAYVRGVPIVLTQHVGIVEHPSKIIVWIQKIVYATWGTLMFRASNTIIVYNTIVKAFLLQRGVVEPKIAQMWHGVDQGLFRPPEPDEREELRRSFGLPDRPLALFVGRFVPKKGIGVLASISTEAMDIACVGSGEIVPAWRKQGMHFLGPLSRERLAEAYRMADVFVLPSHGEMFTLSMQEAAATGLPIITSDEPAYASYDLDREEMLFVERAPHSFEAALTSVLQNDALRASMSEYSRKIAQRWFNREKNIATIIAVFEQFIPARFLTTSWDDGHVLDVRLADLLKKNGIKGTFYIAPEDRELTTAERLSKEDVRTLAQDFEIGAHTLTHPYLPDVDVSTARLEITSSKQLLEEWTGNPVTSFCYPRGGYLPEHQRITQSAGFQCARTTRRFALSQGSDAFAIPTSIHTYDHWSDVWEVLKLARFSPIRFFHLYRRWDRQALALFDMFLKQGGVFHLWGHSWEIEQHGDWTRLENVLKYIANRPGVQYVANNALV